MGGYIIFEHPIWVAISFWNTLYGWLWHCGTPYIGGFIIVEHYMGCYVIVEHPIWVAMSLRNTLYGWLCHCGTPYMGGYVIAEHPI